jgi:hypothetical protein
MGRNPQHPAIFGGGNALAGHAPHVTRAMARLPTAVTASLIRNPSDGHRPSRE